MGKEAKIGLGIILILLIVFGVVLARRLSDPSDGSAAAAPGEKAKPAGEHAGERTKPGGPGARPTVIEAKAGSKTSRSPSSPADVGQWSVVSDSRTSRQGPAGAKPPSAPPSFMPHRPTADPSSPPYNPYRTAQPAGKTAGAWQGGPATASDPNTASQLGDPRQQQPTQTPGGGYQRGYAPTGQLNPTRPYVPRDPSAPASANPLRGQTGATAPRHSGGYGPTAYRPGNPAQHAQAGVAAQRTPAYPAGASSANRTMPKPPQYGPEDYRREDGTYAVGPNDSYWVISEKLYGSGAYFKALAEHNRKKYPDEDKLKVGDVIAAPTKAELVQTYADLCPKESHVEAAKRQAMAVSTRGQYATGRTYEVQEGDTLWDIARWELGKAARWGEILDLNGDILGDDFDHLTPGVKLVLPSDGPADAVTRRNGPYRQR